MGRPGKNISIEGDSTNRHGGYGPLPPDLMKRRPVYDLYHALNPLNLFGAGYAAMVRRCLGG